jgi:hypothetical protein
MDLAKEISGAYDPQKKVRGKKKKVKKGKKKSLLEKTLEVQRPP